MKRPILAICLVIAFWGGTFAFFLDRAENKAQEISNEVVCSPDTDRLDAWRSDKLPDFEDLCPEPTQPDASVGIIPPEALKAAEIRKGEAAVEEAAKDFGSPAVYSNGRLPKAILCAINSFQVLRCDAARAFVAMDNAARTLGLAMPQPCSGSCAYRDLFNQFRVRRAACAAGRCFMAAIPGTSNHGLGIAVDLATRAMRYATDRIGARFGWLKRCSDAGWEWWHLKYNPACTGASFRPTVKKQRVCGKRGVRVKIGKRYKCRPVLKKGVGNHRKAKRRLQRILDRNCIPTPNHGLYTQRVRKSIKKFQRRSGLRADGVMGRRTWQKLERHRNHRHRCRR